MNVLIIPSWYPTADQPITGIFFREQARLLALHHPQHHFCISLWGSHDISLLLTKQKLLFRLFGKYPSMKANSTIQKKLLTNCYEHYTPAYTWSRYVLEGNMKNIISANRKNATLFEAEFGKIDIIYVHVGYPAGYIAMKLSKERSCPYVISEHMGPFPFSSYLNLWEKPMQKLVDAYKNAAQVLAVSTAMKNVIEEKIGFKAVVLHNFIDEHLFKISEKPVPKKILFVGRAEYSKGLDLLIRAFHLSKASSAGYQLYIIGKGSIKDSYNNEPLPEVHFFGELPNTQIANIISESAFLVLPSLFESFGVVLIEALACGKPVVATDCGGPSDIVTATNGVLAKTGDVADLQEKLDWMIDHHHSFDPKAIRAEFLEKFGAKKITSHLMARFKEAIVKFESQNNL